MHDALDLRDLLADELAQRRQSGHDVSGVAADIELALDGPSASPGTLGALLDRLEKVPSRAGWPYREASDAGDPAAWVAPSELPRLDVEVDDALADRLLGAWLGRCAGCLLGKPIEGWTAPQLRTYLDDVDATLDDYVPVPDPWPPDAPPLKPSWPEATRGRIHGMPRDDDLDYTVIGLLVLERMPEGPTTSAVAAEWLARLPFGRVYTAERAAYHNLVAGISPAAAAAHRNPYREWIGALIRVDPYAYVSPGDPGRAARFAARDAMLSHVGNGVAAAMWAAATISLSLAGVAAEHSVRAAVACVPHGFRLREALEEVLAVFDAAQPWERFMALHARLSSAYGWVHAIPNAAAISASLLWGGGDFTRTISLAVLAGGDTDSNGATAGSACGALLGAGRLPEAWVTPLDDTLRTSVAGVANVSISSLAMRCHRLVQASRELAHA